MKRSKKLSLNQETIRQLTGSELTAVAGGVIVRSGDRCDQGNTAPTGDGSVTSISMQHVPQQQNGGG